MISSLELDQFLTDLQADEELRLQAEQLIETRAIAESMAQRYAHFLEASHQALVLTDDYGGLIRASQGAKTLTARRLDKTPRPITTWFRAADRSVIRAVITAARRLPQKAIDVDQVMLRRPDHSELPVSVSVSVVRSHADCRHQLLWSLTPVEQERHPHLRLVSDPSPIVTGSEAEHLTALAAALATATSADDAVKQITDHAAHGFLARAQWVDVYLPDRYAIDVAAFTTPTAQFLNGLQRRHREGPALTALQGEPIVSDNLSRDPRWPGLHPDLVGQPIRGTVAVPLDLGRQPTAAVLWMSDQTAAFDASDVAAASQFAVHAGLGLQRVLVEAQLKTAMVSRQRVGEAVGILIERHRITPKQAFAMLVEASQRSNVRLSEVAERLVETGTEPPAMPAPQDGP
jgi:hypothetical protein